MAHPIRTCVGCRRTDRRDALVRVVRSSTGGAVALDERARLPGRGAWLHRDAVCWQGARAGLSRSFRSAVSDRELKALRLALDSASSPTNDPARDLLGAPASDSGLSRPDAVDIATRSKAQE